MTDSLYLNLTVVTIYSTLGPTAIAHGLNETEITHIITSKDLLQSRLKVQVVYMCVTLELNEKLSSTCIMTLFFPFSLPPTSNSTSQAILCDVPRLQYIIVVDSKPTSWQNLPRGIMVYNMDAVKEMGSKPDNSECL